MHQFGTKVLLGKFIGYALNAVRTWTGDLLMVDAVDLQTIPPSEKHVKSFKSKVETLKRNNEFVFPCRTGEILQGQPLSTAVYEAGGDVMRESQQNSSGEKLQARDPDPDVEARRESESC